MNKYILMVLLVLAGGCNYYQSRLARRPSIDNGGTRMFALDKKHGKKPKLPEKKSDDPAFDAIFGRNSGKEKKRPGVVSDDDKNFLSQYGPGRVTDDPDVQAVKERNRKKSNDVKDDVFGTTGGSFF